MEKILLAGGDGFSFLAWTTLFCENILIDGEGFEVWFGLVSKLAEFPWIVAIEGEVEGWFPEKILLFNGWVIIEFGFELAFIRGLGCEGFRGIGLS